MKSLLQQPKISKLSRDHAPRPGPSQVGLPPRTPLVMIYWTPVETSAKNPDKISGPHRSRDRTMAASWYRKNIIVR